MYHCHCHFRQIDVVSEVKNFPNYSHCYYWDHSTTEESVAAKIHLHNYDKNLDVVAVSYGQTNSKTKVDSHMAQTPFSNGIMVTLQLPLLHTPY